MRRHWRKEQQVKKKKKCKVWVCECVTERERECWQLITLMHWSLRELASLEPPPSLSLFTPPLPALAIAMCSAQPRTPTYPHIHTHLHTHTHSHKHAQMHTRSHLQSCHTLKPAAYDMREPPVLWSRLDILEEQRVLQKKNREVVMWLYFKVEVKAEMWVERSSPLWEVTESFFFSLQLCPNFTRGPDTSKYIIEMKF